MDGQQVVHLYYFFLYPKGSLTSPPPTQSSQALLSAAGSVEKHKPLDSKTGDNGEDGGGRYSVWATLVHYQLRGGERGIHMTV